MPKFLFCLEWPKNLCKSKYAPCTCALCMFATASLSLCLCSCLCMLACMHVVRFYNWPCAFRSFSMHVCLFGLFISSWHSNVSAFSQCGGVVIVTRSLYWFRECVSSLRICVICLQTLPYFEWFAVGQFWDRPHRLAGNRHLESTHGIINNRQCQCIKLHHAQSLM